MPDPAEVARLIELSDERARWLRRCLAYWRDGWRACWPDAFAAGYAQAEADMAARWAAVAHPAGRGGASFAEIERRRWQVRGEQRSRRTFGEPHPDDWPGDRALSRVPAVPVPLRPDGSAYRRLRGVTAAVLGAKPGERNLKLYWAAARLAEMTASGQLDRATATAILTQAGDAVGLSAGEVGGAIARAFQGVAA